MKNISHICHGLGRFRSLVEMLLIRVVWGFLLIQFRNFRFEVTILNDFHAHVKYRRREKINSHFIGEEMIKKLMHFCLYVVNVLFMLLSPFIISFVSLFVNFFLYIIYCVFVREFYSGRWERMEMSYRFTVIPTKCTTRLSLF